MRFALTALLLLFNAGCADRMSRARFLDVTTATVSTEPGHTVEAGPCGGGDFTRRHAPYPLQLQLLGTDRRTYRRMERVAVDVRIKNVSSEAVLVPSSPRPIARRDRPLSGYRHAGLEFVLIDAKGEKFSTDTFVLYGSPAIADSLVRLEPGESITFRLPAMLSGNGYQDERNPILYPAPGMRIATEMWLFAPDEERFRCRFASSANSLPIAIGPTIAAIPEPRYDGRPPVVQEIAPLTTSADRVVRIAGYRLGADHSEEVGVMFSNRSFSLNATVGNSSVRIERSIQRSAGVVCHGPSRCVPRHLAGHDPPRQHEQCAILNRDRPMARAAHRRHITSASDARQRRHPERIQLPVPRCR